MRVIQWLTMCSLVIMASHLPASATIRYVPTDHLQIQGAINASSTGDTIQVTAEDDYEPFTVDEDDLLIEATVSGVAISPDSEDEIAGVIDLYASGTTLRGFTIGDPTDEEDFVILQDYLESDLTVEDCIIQGGVVGISGSNGLTVSGCMFLDVTTAIIPDDVVGTSCPSRSGSMTIEDCVFSGCAIYCSCRSSVTFTGNTVDDATTAIYDLPSGVTVDRCIFSNCSTVFDAGGTCPTITKSVPTV